MVKDWAGSEIAAMRSPSRYLTWDMPMVIDAPVMNPEMTACDR